jgi:hypothetical protein
MSGLNSGGTTSSGTTHTAPSTISARTDVPRRTARPASSQATAQSPSAAKLSTIADRRPCCSGLSAVTSKNHRSLRGRLRPSTLPAAAR